MKGRMIVLLQAEQNSPSQKTCWWNERVQGGQRHVFRRSSSFLQRLHAKSVWRCIWGRPRFRVWSQGVRKLWWGDNDRVCPLNVLGIGPSHKKRRSLSASQTWACSRIAAITKWACAASDVVNGEVGRAREKGDRDRAMVPAVSDASYPGHLVNQSIQSLADFAGKRKL
jgi:hypothetical protein